MNPMTGSADTAERALLDRFAQALARIVHEERPDVLGRTITVAELYQEIAPYRRMRELAGFEIHGDYEHALIRFLSGEGGWAQLDPETAADELGIEAESSDPDLSLYRKFAACDLRMAFDEPLPPRPPQPTEPEPAPEIPLAGIEETLRALHVDPPMRAHPQADELEDTPAPAPAGPGQAAPGAPPPRAAVRNCSDCGQALPAGRDVRFCPFCGVDTIRPACTGCGEPLEQGWRFCVACGTAADS